MVRVFFAPPPSPVSTTVRTSWKTEYRPVLHAESACHLHSSVASLVGALLAESVLIFEGASFFCPPPSPVSTTVRTSWKTESRPVLYAESACHLCLSVAPQVGELLANAGPIFDDSEFFCSPHHHHHFPLQ